MLYHCTHRSNVDSIYRTGVEKERSTGRAKRVWLVDLQRMLWAWHHVQLRHGWFPEDIVFVVVSEYGHPIRRSGRDGVYYSPESIPTHRLRETIAIRWDSVRTQVGRDEGNGTETQDA